MVQGSGSEVNMNKADIDIGYRQQLLVRILRFYSSIRIPSEGEDLNNKTDTKYPMAFFSAHIPAPSPMAGGHVERSMRPDRSGGGLGGQKRELR